MLGFWKQSIPGGDSFEKKNKICELHFDEGAVIKEFITKMADGTEIRIKRDRALPREQKSGTIAGHVQSRGPIDRTDMPAHELPNVRAIEVYIARPKSGARATAKCKPEVEATRAGRMKDRNACIWTVYNYIIILCFLMIQ